MRSVLERILNECLVYKNFLQLSVVGQMENMMAYWPIAVTVCTLPNEKRGENVLTFSDVLPCPLIVLEERMPLDLIYTVTAETNLPVEVRTDIV